MWFERAMIPTETVSRIAAATDDDAHGVRRAVLAGWALGLLWAAIGRGWMRLVSNDPQFTPGGTIFIFVVVGGFGALAGYAFATRRQQAGRVKGLVRRFGGFVPFLGMGPFGVLFLGGLIAAWLPSHVRSRRWLRRALAAVALVATGFLSLAFLASGENGLGLVTVLAYWALSYLLFVSLRFAFEAGRREKPSTDDRQAMAYLSS